MDRREASSTVCRKAVTPLRPPTRRQKLFLGAAVALLIVWIVLLVTLALVF